MFSVGKGDFLNSNDVITCLIKSDTNEDKRSGIESFEKKEK